MTLLFSVIYDIFRIIDRGKYLTKNPQKLDQVDFKPPTKKQCLWLCRKSLIISLVLFNLPLIYHPRGRLPVSTYSQSTWEANPSYIDQASIQGINWRMRQEASKNTSLCLWLEGPDGFQVYQSLLEESCRFINVCTIAGISYPKVVNTGNLCQGPWLHQNSSLHFKHILCFSAVNWIHDNPSTRPPEPWKNYQAFSTEIGIPNKNHQRFERCLLKNRRTSLMLQGHLCQALRTEIVINQHENSSQLQTPITKLYKGVSPCANCYVIDRGKN